MPGKVGFQVCVDCIALQLIARITHTFHLLAFQLPFAEDGHPDSTSLVAKQQAQGDLRTDDRTGMPAAHHTQHFIAIGQTVRANTHGGVQGEQQRPICRRRNDRGDIALRLC